MNSSKEGVNESLELCTKITEVSQQIKCNQQKSKTLAERIALVTESLSKIDPPPSTAQLSQLNKLLKDALLLEQSFDSHNYLNNALQKNTAQIDFQAIQQAIYKLVKSLKLKVPTETLLNEEKDTKDEEQDKNALKELFTKFLHDHDSLKSALEEQIQVIPFDTALISIKSQLEKLNSGKHTEISASEIRLIQKLGAGTYGEVWKASWQGRFVAVKMLLSHDITDTLIQDFKEELEVMSQLNHPNIARLYGASTLNKNQLALIFEFYPNNLYRLIHAEKKKLDHVQKLQLALGIAKGVQYLHEKNLLHKDLKSANILLDAEMNPKISDVGMNKVKSQSSRTKPPSAWMGPELFENKQDLTLKLDIYSYGILLWEIITGEFPFELYKDPTQIALAVQEGQRPEIPADFPAELLGIVTMCWDSDPSKRPSIEEVVKKLKVLLPSNIDAPKATKSASASREGTPGTKKKKKHKEPAKSPDDGSKPHSAEKETKPKKKRSKEETSPTEKIKTENATEHTPTTEKKATLKSKTKEETSEAKPEAQPEKKEPEKKVTEEANNNTAKKGEAPKKEATPSKPEGKPNKEASKPASDKPKEKKEGGCCIVM